MSPGDRNRYSLEVNGDVKYLNAPLNVGSFPKIRHLNFDPFDIFQIKKSLEGRFLHKHFILVVMENL